MQLKSYQAGMGLILCLLDVQMVGEKNVYSTYTPFMQDEFYDVHVEILQIFEDLSIHNLTHLASQSPDSKSWEVTGSLCIVLEALNLTPRFT